MGHGNKRKYSALWTGIAVVILLVLMAYNGRKYAGEDTGSAVTEVDTLQDAAQIGEDEKAGENDRSEAEVTSDENNETIIPESILDAENHSGDPYFPMALGDETVSDIGDARVFTRISPEPDRLTVLVYVTDGALDKVQVTVDDKDTGEEKTQSAKAIEQGNPTELTFDFAMEKCEEQYGVSLVLTDEGEKTAFERTAKLVYSDDRLEDLGWNMGTFDEASDSLDYHYAKHHEEVDAANMYEYVTDSMECRDDCLADPDAWRVTESRGGIPAHKYKNYEDRRFIILTDDGRQILSFGR